MKKATIFSAVIVLSILSACKKDNNNNTPSQPSSSKNELLSAKTWKFTAKTVNGFDIYAQQPGCENDDIKTFDLNGNYTWDEGPTMCDQGSPQIIQSGTWKLIAGDTKLLLTVNGANDTLDVKELSATRLTTEDHMVTQGTAITIIETYGH